jgi:hypothetical protein
MEGRVSIEPIVAADGRAVTVRIPISIRRRGGRKLVLAPDGTIDAWAAPSRRIDNAMVKAIARAFRWREMLENGTHATIAEIGAAEKINESYVGRVLRLNAAGAGHHRSDPGRAAAASVTVRKVASAAACEWREQRAQTLSCCQE